jgi:hypothetical protein
MDVKTGKMIISGLEKLHFYNYKNPITKNNCKVYFDLGNGLLHDYKVSQPVWEISKEKIEKYPLSINNIFNRIRLDLATDLKYSLKVNNMKLKYQLIENSNEIGYPSSKNVAYSRDNSRWFEMLKVSNNKPVYLFSWNNKYLTLDDAQEIAILLFETIL